MGDISIIARRLPNGYVQYGWSGNGGYYEMVGARLDEWYQAPEDVDYLFSLGQTSLIGQKGSEKGGFSIFETHHLTNEPFWLGKTEREIFSKIEFISFGYFYDLDDHWYYVIPGPFRIKIPFVLINNCLLEAEYEFDYCKLLQEQIIKYIFTEYKEHNNGFAEFLEQKGYKDSDSIMEKILNSNRHIYELFKNYRDIFRYFDDWIVLVADESGTAVESIIMRKKEEKHVETIDWLKD